MKCGNFVPSRISTFMQSKITIHFSLACPTFSCSCSISYRIQNFQRRQDALLIALLFDNRGYENAKEENSFSVIVCFPAVTKASPNNPCFCSMNLNFLIFVQKAVNQYIENFTKLIMEKTTDVTNVDKHIFLFNPLVRSRK